MTGRYETETETDLTVKITVEGIQYPADPSVGIFAPYWDDEEITQLQIGSETFKRSELPDRFWKALMSQFAMDEILTESL